MYPEPNILLLNLHHKLLFDNIIIISLHIQFGNQEVSSSFKQQGDPGKINEKLMRDGVMRLKQGQSTFWSFVKSGTSHQLKLGDNTFISTYLTKDSMRLHSRAAVKISKSKVS